MKRLHICIDTKKESGWKLCGFFYSFVVYFLYNKGFGIYVCRINIKVYLILDFFYFFHSDWFIDMFSRYALRCGLKNFQVLNSNHELRHSLRGIYLLYGAEFSLRFIQTFDSMNDDKCIEKFFFMFFCFFGRKFSLRLWMCVCVVHGGGLHFLGSGWAEIRSQADMPPEFWKLFCRHWCHSCCFGIFAFFLFERVCQSRQQIVVENTYSFCSPRLQMLGCSIRRGREKKRNGRKTQNYNRTHWLGKLRVYKQFTIYKTTLYKLQAETKIKSFRRSRNS